MEADAGSGNKGEQPPSNSQQTISDDDEIDYSIKPEFYDPNLDDEDESWVEKKRQGNTTDAVLSCPACFTTLCLECQRHEKYETQYRAIFVVNCKIKTQDVLLYQQSRARPGRAKRRRETAEAEHGGGEEVGAVGRGTFKHVCCSVCSTEVGVIDEEEVYHFYDVLPSEA